MRRFTTVGLAVMTAVVWIGAAAPASPACANKDIELRLAHKTPQRPGYEPGLSAYYPFLWGYEGQDQTEFSIERAGDDCDGSGATVDFDVASGTAQKGSDFGPVQGTTQPLFDQYHHGPPFEQVIPVPVFDDAAQEPIEDATVFLSNPQEDSGGAHLGYPASAPLYIVDDDSASDQLSFAEASYVHLERETDVAIPVFRSGPATEAVAMSYAINPGDTDKDFIDSSGGSLDFDSGQRMKLVRISIVGDGTEELDETFTVTLTGPGAAGTTSTQVTIANDDTGETQQPETKFHHPRHRHNYRSNDWRIQIAWHIFARDTGGSGLAKVQAALRKKMKSGSCAWLSGSRFVRGPCSAKRWLTIRDRSRLRDHPYQWIYVYDPQPRLQPSVGSSIRDYTIYSRATDGADNVENRFRPGRNANTFEVTR